MPTLQDILNDKNNIKRSISNKGVDMSGVIFSQYADKIKEIQTDDINAIYKCTAVDTSNKTWSGQKAVFVNGEYKFEEAINSSLIYTSVTPEVGQIYIDNALIKIESVYEIPKGPTKYKVSGVTEPSTSIGAISWNDFNGVYTSVSKDVVEQENWIKQINNGQLNTDLNRPVTIDDIKYPHKKVDEYDFTTKLFIINGKIFITNNSTNDRVYSGIGGSSYSELPNGSVSVEAYDEFSDSSESQSIRIEKL